MSLRFLRNFFILYIFRIIYLLGLGSFLLYIFSTGVPSDTRYSYTSTWILTMAILLITISIIGVFWTERKSWKKTLFYLGLMSFIPGILSVILISLGGEIIPHIIWRLSFPGQLGKVILLWLERSIPKAIGVSVIYIAIGGCLLLASRLIKKKKKRIKTKNL